MVCIDDEIPFEIPTGWVWARLGVVADIIGGYAFQSQTLKGDIGIRVVRISDVSENGFVNSRLVRYSGPPISDAYLIEKEDILMAMTGGTVGKSLYVKYLPEKMLLNQRVAIIRNKWIISEYLNLVIKAPHIMAVINEKKNSTNDNISMGDIYNFLIPIPPTVYQDKVVKAFYSILPQIERYGDAQNRLDKLNSEIKGNIQKSILQEAIQGRLASQDLTDEPVSSLLERIRVEKQKLLKEGKLKKKDIADSVIFKGEDNKYFDLAGCYEKYGIVYWTQYFNFQKGDTGFIYCSSPDSAVRYKFVVEEHDMKYNPEMDVEIEFYVDPKDFEQSKEHNRFAKLRITKESTSERMGLANLMEHGMKMAPRGALNLSHKDFAELHAYIEENF